MKVKDYTEFEKMVEQLIEENGLLLKDPEWDEVLEQVAKIWEED